MQVYDIIILILVGWLTLRGAMKGMVSQLASIAAVIASFWAAVRFGPVLEPVMKSAFNVQSPWDKVIGITLAFVGASIAVMFVHRVLANLISVIRMQKYDRLCGALFGFLKGVLIGMILTFFAVMLSEQTRKLAVQSRSGKILVRLIQRTQSLLPDDVSTLIEANLDGFRKQLESSTETAEGTISQVKSASDIVTKAKNATELIQTGLTQLTKHFSGENDLADTVPSLSDDTRKSDASGGRDYTMPIFSSVLYPPPDSVQSEPQVPVSGPLQTAPVSGVQTTAASTVTPDASPPTPPIHGSLTNPPAMPLVAPSADFQPMTSTGIPSLPAGSDWRTLLRDMR